MTFVVDMSDFDAAVLLRLADPPPEPLLGYRLNGVLVDHVQVGDFTTFTGYRRVTGVTELTETRGRGSKRATRTVGWLLHRADGTADRLEPGDTLKVYAP